LPKAAGPSRSDRKPDGGIGAVTEGAVVIEAGSWGVGRNDRKGASKKKMKIGRIGDDKAGAAGSKARYQGGQGREFRLRIVNMMLRSWGVVTINARIGRVLHEHQRWKHSRNERHVNVCQPEFGALPRAIAYGVCGC
jgi:hypothetical protein